MIKTTLSILALAAAIAMPALADEGVMPQQSKIIINKTEAQQGVPMGHGATTGKRHAHRHAHMHKGHMHKGNHAHKHHHMHKAAAKKAAM